MKTLIHEFLDIEAEIFGVSQSCYDTIDDILEIARININIEAAPKDILREISGILEGYGFSYEVSVRFSEALQTKKIDCKEYSVLYYSIAEELGLPLNIVSVSDHLFVRWDDGKNLFNWETTDNISTELSVEDSRYILDFNIHEESILNGVYMKNLTREEIKSIAFNINAKSKFDLEDIDGAIDDFSKAIELHPNSPHSYNNRGFANIHLNDLEEALDDFNKAIELDPNYENGYFNRGGVKAYLDDFDGALDDFNKIIELNSNSAKAYYNCGSIKASQDDFKEAKNYFDKAIELNPDFAEAYYARGTVKVSLGDMSGSRDDFDKAEELNLDSIYMI